MTGPGVRRWLVLGLALAAAVAVAVWTTRDGTEWPGALDPRNPGPDGAQALARVLDDQGVDVRIVRSADELEREAVDAGTTVVVTGASALSPSTTAHLRRHTTQARLVLVDPPHPVVTSVDDRLGTLPDTAPDLGEACTGDSALAGLRLDVDEATVYAGAAEDWTTCFEGDDGAAFAAMGGDGRAEDGDGDEDEDGEIVLFGAAQALSNDHITRDDNAAVALRLLGQDADLVWYVPDPADTASDEAVSLSSLIPPWIRPGLFLLGAATLALLLWRVRRLGPLAPEPLPVVVRGVETAHSRGRMYRRSADRGHAATQLRRAARTDLATHLRLHRGATPAEVADAMARHLGDTTPPDLVDLLTDDQPPPADDPALLRLAQELTRLRREVRRR